MKSDLRLFAMSERTVLAQSISQHLNIPLSSLIRKKLSNTETLVEIQESVRGKDVFIIFSSYTDFNNSILDLLMIVEAMNNASVAQITIVFPSFPYARYDTATKQSRCPIARLIADMLGSVSPDRILTMDLHSPQVQGYFDIPVDNITAEPAFWRWIKDNHLRDAVLVTPNPQGTKRVANFSEVMGMKFAIVHIGGCESSEYATRRGASHLEGCNSISIVGDVQGKDCIIYDDIADACYLLTQAAKYLKQNGAKRVFCIATHGLFSEEGIAACNDSEIDSFVVTDTLDQSRNLNLYSKLRTVDVSVIFAEAIRRIHYKEPLLPLFNIDDYYS